MFACYTLIKPAFATLRNSKSPASVLTASPETVKKRLGWRGLKDEKGNKLLQGYSLITSEGRRHNIATADDKSIYYYFPGARVWNA